MDEIELPFLPGDTSLSQAIGTLRSTRANALVTEHAGEPFMLRAIDLIERWNALAEEGHDPAVSMVGEVVPRVRQPRLPKSVAVADLAPNSLVLPGDLRVASAPVREAFGL